MTERPSWHYLYPPGVSTVAPRADTDVLSAFRASVREAGDAPALIYGAEVVRRDRLDAISDELAAAWQQQGIGGGDRIAVALQATPSFAIAVLAAWKLGAIVVLVNPMYRDRELTHLLRDSGARLLIADPALRNAIAGLPAEVVPDVLFSGGADFAGGEPELGLSVAPTPEPRLVDLIARHRGRRPQRDPSPSPVALLTYTSGTTGPAKGAINTHANVAYEVEIWRRWIDLGPDDRILALAPLFHITGFILHLALALGTGTPLVLTYRFDADAVATLVERHRPTFTIASITAFVALLSEPAVVQSGLGSLRKVFTGGAPVAAAVVERFEATFGVHLHNAYGLTETTSGTVAVPLGRRAPVEPSSGALAIGVPLPGTEVSVLDDEGRAAPVGTVGELVMRGPQVASGYWNAPEETAAAFVDGGVRTGDVGFVDADGWVYIVDRKKDLIVASGYKVWPRDVEDVLYEHPAVREAAVVGAPDPYRGETVHAFISVREGHELESDELRDFCRQRLAAYKCPTRFEVRADLPKTATGKILRRALRAEPTRG